MKELEEKIIDKMRSLTGRNDHFGARSLLAEAMNNKKMSNAYDNLAKLHNDFGHISGNFLEARDDLDKSLMSQASNNYSNFNDIRSAL